MPIAGTLSAVAALVASVAGSNLRVDRCNAAEAEALAPAILMAKKPDFASSKTDRCACTRRQLASLVGTKYGDANRTRIKIYHKYN
jgi:hypothetical protein